MPYKKKTTTSKVKKVYRKKTYKPRRKLTNRNGLSLEKTFNGFLTKDPFPPRKNVKLTYIATHTMTSGTLGIFGDQQKYSINSVYKPDATSTGHQPYGFDQMATLYKRYKVNGCLVKLTLSDPSTDGNAVGVKLLNPSNFAGGYINTFQQDQIDEQQQGLVLRVNNTGSQKLTKKFFIPVHQLAGLSKLQYKTDIDNLTAAVTSNPGTELGFCFALANDNNVGGTTIKVIVELIFYVTFYQRVQLSQSAV